MYGILGGMGPLATADLVRKIIELTPAAADQEHLPLLVCSIPQIPDRSAAIVSGGPSPLDALADGVRLLAGAGCREIAIACNTAHHWFDDLAQLSPDRLLHVVDAVLASLRARSLAGCAVGLMATDGTISSGFYQRRLAASGYALVLPSPAEMVIWIWPGIQAVKAGNLDRGRELLGLAATALQARGADILVLACTEMGVVLQDDGAGVMLDSSLALAHLCAERWGAEFFGSAASSVLQG